MLQKRAAIFVVLLGFFIATSSFSAEKVTLPTEQELYEQCIGEHHADANIWNTPAQREAA